MHVRVCAIRSGRRIRSDKVEFDLSEQRTRIPLIVRAVCECVHANECGRLERTCGLPAADGILRVV